MAIPDLPILSMLRTRMQWHQQRQKVLAENVANADTPHYRARDLAPPTFTGTLQRVSLSMALTDPGHIEPSGGTSQFEDDRSACYETRPRGTTVSRGNAQDGRQSGRLRRGDVDLHPQPFADQNGRRQDLGPVGIQDSHPGLVVIQALDGPIRFE
jgi:flagellar basal-body rod protein FlgB